MLLSPVQRLRHLFIRSRWKRWLVPVVCTLPYLGSLIWLVARQQAWIAQVMLAPLLMTFMLGMLTLALSHLEFRR